MRAGRPAIVSDPVPPQSVIDARATRSAPTCGASAATSTTRGDRQQWTWAGREQRYQRPGLSGAARRQPAAQRRRRAGGLRGAARAAADHRRRRCATGWRWSSCPGRFQIVPGQPTLVLDVAHNPQRSRALALNLDQMGFYPRTHAVFGAMRDKDIAGIAATHGAAGRCLVLHRPADCRAPRAPRELAQRSQAADARQPPCDRACHADPIGAALRPLGRGGPR